MMVTQVFINMAFLISFISIGSQLLKRHEFDKPPSLLFKWIMGIIQGGFGIVLMYFSVKINSNVILDFRDITIVMSAMYCGPLSAIICGVIIAGYRIVIFGVSLSSIVSAVTVTAITFGCILIAKSRKTNFAKWAYSTLCIGIFTSATFIFLLNGKTNLLYVLIVFWLSTLTISFFCFYYVRYCIETNMLFSKFQKESTQDHLTGLNNVRRFDEVFNLSVSESRKKQVGLSLLMIDIDYFKKINDTYGHQAGDFVLIELGKIIVANCGNLDTVSRIGGEEFTVILLDCSKESAIQIAEKTRDSVEHHDFELPTGEHIKITVSIGLSNYPESTEEYDRLLEKSDISLYCAKRSGRNRVSCQ